MALMKPEETKNLITDLLTKLGVSFDSIEPKSLGRHTLYQVATKDSGVLIGNGGENLRALNYIARKLAERVPSETDEGPSFLVDINGYQEKHIETIRSNAKMLAERAKLFKHDVEMSPMSAYERMIVHELFAEDSQVITESHGEGKYRRVVIKCRTPEEEGTLKVD